MMFRHTFFICLVSHGDGVITKCYSLAVQYVSAHALELWGTHKSSLVCVDVHGGVVYQQQVSGILHTLLINKNSQVQQ